MEKSISVQGQRGLVLPRPVRAGESCSLCPIPIKAVSIETNSTEFRPDASHECFRQIAVAGILLSALVLCGCRKGATPVTISFLDPESLWTLGNHRMISDDYLQEFTQQTGIRVNHLPAPEDSAIKLRIAMDLLRSGAPSPDVYGIDTIWSGAFSPYLLDLKPYFGSALSPEDREILGSYIVDGKIVGMPYHPNIQVLYYRIDLLSKYGYSEPPRTWDELEKIALQIQRGERSRGDHDFWGFVWAGAITAQGEQLTCEGLEWQVAEGGGHIIEADQKISVNNKNAVEAWQRAAHWVGWISPPGVVSYTDWDASNDFWISGRAAFQLGWSDNIEIHAVNKPYYEKAGVTGVPAGREARVTTLGGYALGVSKSSAHRDEAIRLIRFLTRKQAQFKAAGPPARKSAYFEVPMVMGKIYPWWCKPCTKEGGEAISRPSGVTGGKYELVSEAYARALHSVLTGESPAPDVAVNLEKELVQITGFKTTSN